MIDPDRTIVHVKRVYKGPYKGPCYDFIDGSLYMSVGDQESAGEGLVDCPKPIYLNSSVVSLSDAARQKFATAGWPLNVDLWIAVEDTEPVSDDLDAQIRAVYALTGDVVDADSLFVNED